MRNFTKLISFFLIFSLLIGYGSVVNAVSVTSISADAVDGKKGETVIVPINIISNSGLVSLSLNVTYDESVLTLIEVRDQGVLGNEYHKSNFSSPYRLTWENKDIQQLQ